MVTIYMHRLEADECVNEYFGDILDIGLSKIKTSKTALRQVLEAY